MNREKVLNLIGLSLLGACFVVAIARVFSRTTAGISSGTITIRFAHFQLEPGVRDAFDAVAREYEKTHTGIKVTEMAIPETVYSTWTTTQLVGGTAPDLMELGAGLGTDERLARYFQPLTKWLGSKNPYNAGTPLAGTPWRETFLDGLSGWPNYNASLLDVYSIPNTVITIRIFYNKDLYKKIAGTDKPPATYQEFVRLCEKVEKDGGKIAGHKIVPIAGSMSNGRLMTDELFRSQVQKLWAKYQGDALLQPNGSEAVLRFAVLKHQLSLYDPAIVSACQIVHDVGQYMQPGFMQVARDDAMFMFTQGNALMIAAGSYDSAGLRSQSPFEIGVFPVPYPTKDDPEYGKFVLGRATEAGAPTQEAFAMTLGSRNQEQVVDFLRFMTSMKMNGLFAEKSGLLPAVVGVKLQDDMKPFQPILDGCINGFRLDWGADVSRVLDNNTYRLVDPDGSPKNFLDGIQKDFMAALVSDSQSADKAILQNSLRQDVSLAAFMQLSHDGPDPEAKRKVSELNESENQKEIGLYNGMLELNELGLPLTK